MFDAQGLKIKTAIANSSSHMHVMHAYFFFVLSRLLAAKRDSTCAEVCMLTQGLLGTTSIKERTWSAALLV